jgi:hypothetical protein
MWHSNAYVHHDSQLHTFKLSGSGNTPILLASKSFYTLLAGVYTHSIHDINRRWGGLVLHSFVVYLVNVSYAPDSFIEDQYNYNWLQRIDP